MKVTVTHIKRIVLFTALFPVLLTSCIRGVIDRHEICTYNVQIVYHYNQENTSPINQISRFVRSLDEYLFDSDGVLYAIHPKTLDICTGEWISELMLPPGRYTVISMGNSGATNTTTDSGMPLQVGVTKREDVLHTLVTPSANGDYINSDRLYHGYRTFSVESGKQSYVRVDMVHSHLDLRYTIYWKGNAAPANTNDFYVILKDVPSEYHIMPEFVYPVAGSLSETYDALLLDEYALESRDVRHHITTVEKVSNIINYQRDVIMFGNYISGQTISYRLRNSGHGGTESTLSLYSRTPDSSNQPTRLMKEIPLNDYLNRSYVDLNLTLKQQYHLVFVIDPDTGLVDVMFAEIADWDEGGTIGGY